MRIFRNITIIQLILELILLGAIIVLTIATLLFGDELGGIKTLAAYALVITILILRLYFTLNILKREESLHRKNTLNRIWFERKALEEKKRTKELREERPGQIDDKLNQVLTARIWMRMLRYESLMRVLRYEPFIRFLFFAVTSLVFKYIFNFRLPLSLTLGLIVGFLTGKIWHTIINHRIVILFEKEFPSGSAERAIAIDYLSNNKYTYWFASELLKIVGL